MSIVCIPYRSDGGLRDRARDYVQSYWEGSGREVVFGSDESEPFSPARARNDAARNAGDWEVAIFCDADSVLGSSHQASQAEHMARESKGYVICHSRILYLEDAATETVYAGVTPVRTLASESALKTSETCFAIHRSLWDEIGGYDERFIGWGWQGICFFLACLRLGKVNRVQGDIYHLWHGPYWSDRPTNPYLEQNTALANRYKAANAIEMRELVREWR